MADNLTYEEAASGPEVATDERTIGAATVHLQRVEVLGASTIDAGSDATVTTTAESVAGRETRKRITLRTPTTNTANVLIGATGDEVFPIEAGGSLTLETTAAVFYKAASGTQTLYWVEEYS